MKKFVGASIKEAVDRARLEFLCRESELEYEVVVEPKKGFFGLFGKQEAVILAWKKEEQIHKDAKQEFKSHQMQENQAQDSYAQIQDNFFGEKPATPDLTKKLHKEISELLALLPYKIEEIKVKIEQNSYVNLEINGEDCGLLIGEKGYRYKAIHYLLSVWIKKDYGLGLRLEIADFLKNKERKIEEYLEEHYESIISRSSFQTQIFDPLSAGIALRKFREAMPDKYIVIKQISENESIILVNEFRGR